MTIRKTPFILMAAWICMAAVFAPALAAGQDSGSMQGHGPGGAGNANGMQAPPSGGQNGASQGGQNSGQNTGMIPGEPPGGFAGNMTRGQPPEGFAGNMTMGEPPEGFDGNMTRGHHGGFDGNLTAAGEPPAGFDGNRTAAHPPGSGQAATGTSGNTHVTGTGSQPQDAALQGIGAKTQISDQQKDDMIADLISRLQSLLSKT